MLNLDDFCAAHENIAEVLNETHLQYSATFSNAADCQVYLKPENLQKTGAFKIRGAYNVVKNLSQERRDKGVITASSGNHGQAVAYAAAQAGFPAVVVMPENAPQLKIDACRGYGAEVVLEGIYPDQRREKAKEMAAEEGLFYVDSTADEGVIGGQGTISLEILAELPETDVIVGPIGGGGLISGVAACAKLKKPKIDIFGVEPRQSPAMHDSLEAGNPVELPEVDTVADGMMARRINELNFRYTQRFVDEVFLVTEQEIVDAMRLLLERTKILVEPSGAVSLAAILSGRLPVEGKNVVAVLSGGNVDLDRVDNLFSRYQRCFPRDTMKPMM